MCPKVSWRQDISKLLHLHRLQCHHRSKQRQLYLPVRWTECVQALAAGGATQVAECGPGKVLSGLIKRIDKSVQSRAIGAPAEMDAALAEWR